MRKIKLTYEQHDELHVRKIAKRSYTSFLIVRTQIMMNSTPEGRRQDEISSCSEEGGGLAKFGLKPGLRL